MGDVVEQARTRAVGKQDVIEHIDRLGQTPFCLNSIDVFVDKNVGIGFSQIHHLRTQAADLLQEKILSDYSKNLNLENVSLTKLKKDSGNIANKEINVCAIATNPHTARAAKKCGASTIYVPKLNYKRGTAVYQGAATTEESQAGYPNGVVLMEPTVYSDIDSNSKNVFCDNMSAVYQASDLALTFEVGPHIPAVNRHSIELLIKLGAKRIWLSPELSLAQINDLIAPFPDMSFGIYVKGAAELMLTKHCHLMSMGHCNQNCASCQRRLTQHYLLDRKGYEFPIMTDIAGICHIYNSTSLDICHATRDLIDCGVDSFMVDTTLMSTEETAHATGRAVASIKSNVEKVKNCTTGHLYKTVL